MLVAAGVDRRTAAGVCAASWELVLSSAQQFFDAFVAKLPALPHALAFIAACIARVVDNEVDGCHATVPPVPTLPLPTKMSMPAAATVAQFLFMRVVTPPVLAPDSVGILAQRARLVLACVCVCVCVGGVTCVHAQPDCAPRTALCGEDPPGRSERRPIREQRAVHGARERIPGDEPRGPRARGVDPVVCPRACAPVRLCAHRAVAAAHGTRLHSVTLARACFRRSLPLVRTRARTNSVRASAPARAAAGSLVARRAEQAGGGAGECAA